MNDQMMAHLPKWIQEIAERESKATKGPWCDVVTDDGYREIAAQLGSHTHTVARMYYERSYGPANAAFAAHARTDVPRLIELVGEMAGALERLMPEECYGGEAEDAAHCNTCQLRDNCDRYMVLRVLAKWRGEVPSGE